MKNNGIFESVKQKLFWLEMLTAMLMVSQVTFAEDWACAYVQTWDGSSNASYKVDNNCDFVSQTSIDNKDFGTLGENFYIKFYALRNSDENDNGLLKYQIDNGDWQEKKLSRDADYSGNPRYGCELNVIGFGLSSGPHTIQFCIRVPHSNDKWWINNGGSNYTIKFTIGTSPEPVSDNFCLSIYKNDYEKKFYFTKKSENEYIFDNIVIDNYTGNTNDYKYWIGKDDKWVNNMSENFSLGSSNASLGTVSGTDYISYCPNGKLSVKIYSNSSDKNWYPHDWSCGPNVIITASSQQVDLQKRVPLVLHAKADGASGKYVWQKCDAEAQPEDWKDIATTEADSYTITEDNLPIKSTKYRVKCGDIISSNVWGVSVFASCGEETTGENIFTQDFGTINSPKGRKPLDGITYNYQEWPKKINDGDYALIADVYWCGCGDGSNMGQSVEECTPATRCTEGGSGCENVWYRPYWYGNNMAKTRDHTLDNQGETGTFGLMLMINYKKDSKLAYEHILTPQEKAKMVPGSNVRLSASIASAAKRTSGVKVDMYIELQFKAKGGNTWNKLINYHDEVSYENDWKTMTTPDFVLGNDEGDYKLLIYTNGDGSGNGNDVLIDDIKLDVCIPKLSVAFYSNDGSVQWNKVLEHTDSTYKVKTPYFVIGTLTDPYLMLFEKTKDGKYIYTSTMPLNQDGKFYETTLGFLRTEAPHEGDSIFTQIPGEQKEFFVVATTKANVDGDKKAQVITKIENGDIVPGEDVGYILSSNSITYDFACPDDDISAKVNGNATYCETDNQPELVLNPGKVVSKYVYYNLYEDNTPIFNAQAVKISESDIAVNEVVVDLQQLVKSDICPDCNLDISAGKHEYTFDVFERLSDDGKDYCVKSMMKPVTLTVIEKPSGTLDEQVTKCDKIEKDVAVTANAETYQWQINTNPPTAVAADWQDITGATSANYTIPKDAADGSEYRVMLGNQYCTPQPSTVMNLKVEQCDDVALTISPASKPVCKGEEVEFTLTLTNLGDVATDVSVTEDASEMSGFEFIKATPSQGSFSSNVWTINGFAKGATATLTLKYKAKVDTEVKGTEKVYVSRLGESIWGSYDEQTDNNMKASSEISAKEVTDAPILSDPYDECQKLGVKELSDFVTSDKSDLRWYSDAELKNEVNPAVFNMNVPTPEPTPTTHGTMYYVTNQESGKCVSYPAAQSVTVRKAPAPIVTKDFIKCTNDKKLDLQTLVTNYDAENIYSYYYDGVILNDKVIDLESGASKTYSVQAVLGECESNMADMTVSVKAPVTSVLLKEKDDVDEYDLDGVPTVKRNLGMSTEKVLTITPTDAPNYSLKWYLGDAEFDGSFPRKPYADQIYKAVVVDECGNTHIANAGTQVEWPTIFMPYDNSTNKDFVVGIDGGIELYVFDRSGNMVAHTADGWDGFANQNGNTKIAMPGLYYYKAILPDGSVKKGTVEVFKK